MEFYGAKYGPKIMKTLKKWGHLCKSKQNAFKLDFLPILFIYFYFTGFITSKFNSFPPQQHKEKWETFNKK